jgi:hypothetical protein
VVSVIDFQRSLATRRSHRRPLLRRLALVALLVTMIGCGSEPGSKPSAPAGDSQGGAHVFVIVLENRGFSQALSQPYVAQLASQYAQAVNYHAVAHPSLPNYLALTSGSTWGIRDDEYHKLPQGGIGDQLTGRHIPWRAYMEGMGDDCMAGGEQYAVKHNPFAYYGGQCPANVVPLSQLDQDLEGGTPRFAWITPDLCHDGHDCGAAEVDGFLQDIVPRIVASSAWRQNGALMITWDEDDNSGGGNHVMTLVISPHLKARVTASSHNHYSLLATVEDTLGLPRLGHAATATPFKDVLG